MEPVEPVQMNIYQSNSYRKNLSWLYFDDAPVIQQSCLNNNNNNNNNNNINNNKLVL